MRPLRLMPQLTDEEIKELREVVKEMADKLIGGRK